MFTAGIFKRQSFKVLDGVSLHISPGETLGLVGGSGCGKSTLARVILGLVPASSGRVVFKGRELPAGGNRRRDQGWEKMQIIFQHPEASLNPRLKIRDSLAEPLRIHRLVTDREEEAAVIAGLLETVGLSREHLSRYPHELSGGQIQRVVLARILALRPACIIADEPTSMLDVSVQAQVLRLLKDIQARYGLACLFISHDLAVVRWMSDRIAVMSQGRIVETGLAAQIIKNPGHPYTAALVREEEFF